LAALDLSAYFQLGRTGSFFSDHFRNTRLRSTRDLVGAQATDPDHDDVFPSDAWVVGGEGVSRVNGNRFLMYAVVLLLRIWNVATTPPWWCALVARSDGRTLGQPMHGACGRWPFVAGVFSARPAWGSVGGASGGSSRAGGGPTRPRPAQRSLVDAVESVGSATLLND